MISGVMYLAENNCVKKTKELGHEIPFFLVIYSLGILISLWKIPLNFFYMSLVLTGLLLPILGFVLTKKLYQIASKFANFIYSMKTNIDQDIH